MKFDRKDMLLYAVTDSRWLKDGERLYDQVEEALKGGATFVQLREKKLDAEHFFEEAVEIKELCRKYHVPFVINDNVDIALKMDADGVHVGQEDMEAGSVREKLGPDKIIGVSAHTVEEALLAEKRGADYLGVGAVFPTGSKDDASVLDADTVREIVKAVKIPVIAIGGISMENVGKLKGYGLDGVAVISAIFAQEHIVEATAKLKEAVGSVVNIG
jgi:thiamine-phosphate pyrophosphorylase